MGRSVQSVLNKMQACLLANSSDAYLFLNKLNRSGTLSLVFSLLPLRLMKMAEFFIPLITVSFI